MKLVYPAIFSSEEGTPGYAVEFPDLPGCFSCGDSLAEALFMAADAASGWVLDELENGHSAPEASSIDSIATEDGQFVSLIALDMESYSAKYGKKSQR